MSYQITLDIALDKRAKKALYCSPDYQINWTFESGEVQIDFQDSGPGTILDF